MPSLHQHIRLSGAPFERGLAYGTEARERILRVIEEYKVLFDKEAHIPWEEAYARAAAYEEPVRMLRPDLIEEMRGVSEGSGVDFQTILLLNARSEVMFGEREEDACTVIGVPPEATPDGKTYLAQNWDWWSIGRDTTVLLEIDQPPYPKAFIITEAGLLGGKGINSAGIGISLNAMSVSRGRRGVPLHIMLREALSQPTVPKAIDAIARMKRAGSGAIGIVGADGLVVSLEAAPSTIDVLLCDGHPLCHTNHWLSPKMVFRSEATQYSYSSTFTRLDRARRLIRPLEGRITPEALIGVLSDHAGNPEGICRHDDPAIPEYHRHSSLWCMVLDVAEREVWLTEGSPCSSEVRRYKLG